MSAPLAILPDRPKVDALPYIDTHVETYKPLVDKEISAEMKRYPKTKDYLAHMPLPDFKRTPVMETEFQRLQRGEKMEVLDMGRYNVEGPGEKGKNSLDAWKTSLDQARIQSEHQELRGVNLDLLQRYGANANRVFNGHLEFVISNMEAQLENVRQETDDVNHKRKLEQEDAGQKLRKLEHKWQQATRKNVQIDIANELLRQEVAKLKDELKAREKK